MGTGRPVNPTNRPELRLKNWIGSDMKNTNPKSMGWVSGLAMCNPRRPEPNMCLLSLFYFLCLYTYAKGKPLSRVQNFRSRVQTPSARLQRYTSFCDPCSSSIVIFFSLNLRLLLFNLLFLFKVKTATPYFSFLLSATPILYLSLQCKEPATNRNRCKSP